MINKMKLEISDANSDTSQSSDENSQNSSDFIVQQNVTLVSLDGIHSGVPTRTTATLTPTTLRNIEQTFIELTSEPPGQAGFVPPLAPFAFEQEHSLDSTGSGSGSDADGSEQSWQTPPADDIGSSSSTPNPIQQTTSRRNMGGRRPTKSSNLSPEEEEKRKVRRERNKLAAARCRKRRVDHTNELVEEVESLEKKKQSLQNEIQQLKHDKEDIEFLLDNHRAQCRLKNSHHQNNNNNANNNNNLNNQNNNNNNINNNNQKTTTLLDIKPINVSTHLYTANLMDKVKIEPIDDILDGPPSPKRILLSSTSPNTLNTPVISSEKLITSSINKSSSNIPNNSIVTSKSSIIATTTATTTASPKLTLITTNNPTLTVVANGGLTTPLLASNSLRTRPNRPSSLNVPLTLTPSQQLSLMNNNKNLNDFTGVPITTPSNGMFNFDSLMDGGTGLTPVSGPLVQICSSQTSKHPLELTTPTSEASKLVSL